MRLVLLLALAGFATTAVAACDDGQSGDLTGGGAARLRHGPAGPPAAGSPQTDDNSDDGTTGSDPLNPNVATSPNAPTSAGTPNPEFALTLGNATPTVGLGDTTEIDVTVEGKNGFSAPVNITVGGLPDGATAAPLQIVGGAGKLAITAQVTTPTTPANQSVPLVITGSAGGITATANANFKVAPKLLLTLPVNIDALRAAGTQYRDEWGAAFGQNQQALLTQTGNGIVVTVFNADSKAHIIHGANGFAHGDTNNPIQPNAMELSGSSPRTRTLNVGTNANGYPHDGSNGAGASFRIKVDATP